MFRLTPTNMCCSAVTLFHTDSYYCHTTQLDMMEETGENNEEQNQRKREKMSKVFRAFQRKEKILKCVHWKSQLE